MGEPMQVRVQRAYAGHKGLGPTSDRRAGLRRLVAKLRHIDGQQSQPLAEVVVQVPRDPFALVLVGADQSGAELVQFGLGGPVLRDVRRD